MKRDPDLKKLDSEQLTQAIASTKKARAIKDRQGNLYMMSQAFVDFAREKFYMPATAIVGKDGKPLLSWCVALLQRTSGQGYYDLFKLDESWDSEHNRKLIAKMPSVYHGPNKKLNDEGKTVYLAPVGTETLFPPDGKKLTFEQISTGGNLSKTILLVEANDDAAVIWTKPDDLPVDLKQPLKGLLRPGQDFILVATADGRSGQITNRVKPEALAEMFTWRGRKQFEWPWK
jgi:hypothetical protein